MSSKTLVIILGGLLLQFSGMHGLPFSVPQPAIKLQNIQA